LGKNAAQKGRRKGESPGACPNKEKPHEMMVQFKGEVWTQSKIERESDNALIEKAKKTRVEGLNGLDIGAAGRQANSGFGTENAWKKKVAQRGVPGKIERSSRKKGTGTRTAPHVCEKRSRRPEKTSGRKKDRKEGGQNELYLTRLFRTLFKGNIEKLGKARRTRC